MDKFNNMLWEYCNCGRGFQQQYQIKFYTRHHRESGSKCSGKTAHCSAKIKSRYQEIGDTRVHFGYLMLAMDIGPKAKE